MVLDHRWELRELVATGGMGEIHRGSDRSTDRSVAVKVLRRGVADGQRRFASEIEALQRLDHPNIVGLVGTGEHEGMPFLVMELVEGPTLEQRLRAGPLDLDELHRLAEPVASALAFAHAQGIVHRDVTPGNVLFDGDGVPHVADFGIARLADVTAFTSTGITVGTARYVAPEQLMEAAPVGPPADVYSLGLVLLEAATGRRAFAGSARESALARLSRDPELPSELPREWQRLLRAMTAAEPEARPTSEHVEQLLAEGLPLDRTETLQLHLDAPQDATALATTAPRTQTTQAFASLGTGRLDDGAGGIAPVPTETETGERARLPIVVLAAMVLVVTGLVFLETVPRASGQPQDDGRGASDPSPAEQLPDPLDDAFERLHRSVLP